MSDITHTLQAKSDQLNAVDLAKPQDFIIVSARVVSGDQPLVIELQGQEGRPWKPSKGMRRVIAKLWGTESDDYIGRTVRLFNEPSVTWAGKAVGGIEIAGMSDITEAARVAVTTSRGKFKTIIVEKLEPAAPPAKITQERAADLAAKIASREDGEEFTAKVLGFYKASSLLDLTDAQADVVESKV